MDALPKITSRDNQRLINARRIRDRSTLGKIFIEGKRLSVEALRSGVGIEECFVSERFVHLAENAELLAQVGTAARFVFELPDRIFQTIAATEHSQGIILIAECPTLSPGLIHRRIGEAGIAPIVIMLYQIGNPSNLGAILRTAEAAGIAGVIVSSNSTDIYSPKSLRASMGAAFRLPVWKDVDFHDAVVWANENGLVPTAAAAGPAADYTMIDWRKPRLLIFGSEAHGLSGVDLGTYETVRIPMEGGVESLNIAVASGVILFEAKRQKDVVDVSGSR